MAPLRRKKLYRVAEINVQCGDGVRCHAACRKTSRMMNYVSVQIGETFSITGQTYTLASGQYDLITASLDREFDALPTATTYSISADFAAGSRVFITKQSNGNTLVPKSTTKPVNVSDLKSSKTANANILFTGF